MPGGAAISNRADSGATQLLNVPRLLVSRFQPSLALGMSTARPLALPARIVQGVFASLSRILRGGELDLPSMASAINSTESG